MRGVLKSACLAIVAFLAAPDAGHAFDMSSVRPHVTFNLGSKHINAARGFEEFNPGIGVGFTMPTGIGRSELGFEVGQYRNSLRNQSVYVTGSLDMPVADLTDRTELRVGVFGGLSHYGSAAKFKNSGVPTVGDWVVAAGGQATLRIDDTYDLRVRVMPAGNVADALVTLQLGVRF